MFNRFHAAIFLAAFIALAASPAIAFMPVSSWYGCGTNCHFERSQQFGRTLIFAQTANVVTFFVVAFLLGLTVRWFGWRVGYTRKILALILYVAPFFFGYWWSIGYSWLSVTVTAGVFLLCVLALSEPVRTRNRFLQIAFLAIDRPEDRPLTIRWLATAVIATWAVVMVWHNQPVAMVQSWLSGNPRWASVGTGISLSYLLLALFISGVGDALAEPAGLTFGKHKYRVPALWTDRRYTRSVEGSACVFVCGVIGVLLVQAYGLGFWGEFWWALLLVPAVATLAEAFAPHTWDQPFIIASCWLASYAIGWLA